jgi:hypothetical protein
MRSDRKHTTWTKGRTTTTLAAACALALCLSGCITLAGDQLPDIETRPLEIPPPSIEQTIGAFSFHLDGGKMITSVKAGRYVNQMVLDRWQRRGLIAKESYVKSSQFTGNAEYNLTLAGHQEGGSSAVMQFLSGFTLFLIPYWVNTRLDVVYQLEHVESDRKFEARASDSYLSITQLLFFPISPFAMGGLKRTYNRLADHLYEQLAEQGAFDPKLLADAPAESGADPAEGAAERGEDDSRSAVERLKLLDELRRTGVVTDEEYDAKKREILEGL